MQRLAVPLILLVLAGLASAVPAWAQEDGDATDTPTAEASPAPSSSAEADASTELPVCPPGRTTTLTGGACLLASSSEDASQPDFASLGVLSGAQERVILAGADAR